MNIFKAYASFTIPGPSPVGTIFTPTSYSDYSVRGITGTITHQIGQFSIVFMTNMRLDESKVGNVTSLTPPAIIKSPENSLLRFDSNHPTQIYQPLNAAGYNWQVTVVIFLKNTIGMTVDFPSEGVKDLSIDIEWECKPQ